MTQISSSHVHQLSLRCHLDNLLVEVGPLHVMQKVNGLGWTWKLKGACATFYCILQYANFFSRLNSILMKSTDLYYLS